MFFRSSHEKEIDRLADAVMYAISIYGERTYKISWGDIANKFGGNTHEFPALLSFAIRHILAFESLNYVNNVVGKNLADRYGERLLDVSKKNKIINMNAVYDLITYNPGTRVLYGRIGSCVKWALEKIFIINSPTNEQEMFLKQNVKDLSKALANEMSKHVSYRFVFDDGDGFLDSFADAEDEEYQRPSLDDRQHVIQPKTTTADNTEKVKAARLAALQAEKEENKAQSIDRTAKGWIYNASQKRLYNELTGENLYTYDALGFSIAKDCFVLHNRAKERRIAKESVMFE